MSEAPQRSMKKTIELNKKLSDNEKVKKGMAKLVEKATEVKDKREYLDLSNPPKSRKELYEQLSKWLFLTDTYRIDLVLASVVSNQARNSKPLWIFTVGQSGDAKSEIVRALKDYPDVEFIDQISANTLATGKTHKGKKVHDLGDELENSSHILIFSDLATLKSINKDEKNEIFGQLRELYDGNINKRTGNGTQKIYSNCHVTLIACTTPDIKEEYSIHNQLGTREFAYDVESKQMDDNEKMTRAMDHMEKESIMKKELQEIIQSFLGTCKFNKKTVIPPEITKWMMERCKELSLFRATASFEARTGELRGFASKEVPTRLIQQFVLLYKSLKSIDKDYPEERFKHIIENIVNATGDPVRQKIYHFLKDNPGAEFNVQMLHEQLLIGRRTAKSQCELLTVMGIVTRTFKIEYYGGNNNLERNVRYYMFGKAQKIEQKVL